MQFGKTLLTASAALMLSGCNSAKPFSEHFNFNRVATHPVCQQIDATCNTDAETAPENVATSEDGNTLVYIDSPAGVIGFADITIADMPVGMGTLTVDGEPTSVAIVNGLALVGVNTSPGNVAPSGKLAVVDIATQSIVTTISLSGQPDSLAISPDGNYAAIVIENERDEDPGDGAAPQAPAGTVDIIALSGTPATWTVNAVDITGIADLYTGNPEPEYIDINDDNIAVVTLQKKNHIVLIDVSTATLWITSMQVRLDCSWLTVPKKIRHRSFSLNRSSACRAKPTV